MITQYVHNKRLSIKKLPSKQTITVSHKTTIALLFIQRPQNKGTLSQIIPLEVQEWPRGRSVIWLYTTILSDNMIQTTKFTFTACKEFTVHVKQQVIKIIICPISIAYSMGQIINSVCLCHKTVCLSVRTLTVALLYRFSLKVTNNLQK